MSNLGLPFTCGKVDKSYSFFSASIQSVFIVAWHMIECGLNTGDTEMIRADFALKEFLV